jgi:hypothetical protein
MHKQFAKAATATKPGQPDVLIPLPPQAGIQHLPLLEIRSWSQKAPWHDRVYLWAGGPDDESGRGLMLIEALCVRWDCGASAGWHGKVVWAELRVD